MMQLKQAEKDFEVKMKTLDVDVFALEFKTNNMQGMPLVKIGLQEY